MSGLEPRSPSAQERKQTHTPLTFARTLRRWEALDRLDLRFQWGRYGIRVLHCHLTSFAPGFLIPFHQHSEFEFHYIPKGKGRVAFADREYELHEGLFYVTGPGVLHQQWSDEDDPMYEICLHCAIEPLAADDPAGWGADIEAREAEECMRILNAFPAVPVADRYGAMAAFLDAYRVWAEPDIGFYTSVKQAVVQMLLRTVRVLAPREELGTIPERDMAAHRFRMASQYMHDNASRPITLEEVAAAVGVSARQLQRIFRSEGETTFRSALEDIRLSRVCADLLTTDLPVEEVAVRNGYGAPNYLFPVFKQKYGMTPAAFRRQHSRQPIHSEGENAP